MRTVSVPVIRAFEFEGRDVKAGETLAVSPAVAAALHRRGVVSLDRQYRTRDIQPEPDPEPIPEPEPAKPARTRRQYKRRDLKAED